MPKTRKFSELAAELDANPDYPAIAERVAAKLAAEDAAYEHSLRELRRARSLTQVELAKALGTTQPAVSEMESRTDLFISTLRNVVEAMGGHLHVFAEFDDAIVPIETFADIDHGAEPKSGAA
jgi:Helix-turn-helix domain